MIIDYAPLLTPGNLILWEFPVLTFWKLDSIWNDLVNLQPGDIIMPLGTMRRGRYQHKDILNIIILHKSQVGYIVINPAWPHEYSFKLLSTTKKK